MRRLSWKRLQAADLPALEAYLRSREEEAAGFIGRLLKDGRLRMPPPFRSSLAIAVAEEGGGPGERTVEGAILRNESGLVFPLLPPGPARGRSEGIPPVLAEGISSTIGPAGDVGRFEAAFGLRPLVVVAYDLMARPLSLGPPRIPPKQAGLVIYPARQDDLLRLLPLQEAYEVEEVLTPIHRFDAGATRAGLARSLRDQVLFWASLEGSPVAKGGTNARAFTLDQLGGIYVAPPYRRRGIGEALVSTLVGRLEAEGREAVLFVKTLNEAAFALYDSLGFQVLGEYRADYFGG